MEPDLQEGIIVQLLPEKLRGQDCGLHSWEIVVYKMLECLRRYKLESTANRTKEHC